MKRYDTRCYINVRSKANMSQLNLTVVCLSHYSTTAAAGLLLSAVWVGDIDRQRRPSGVQDQRRSAANASSVTLTADVGS